MLKNHLKSILRSLRKNKGYAAINISGLAIGFAAAILIAIYVNQEFTYDKHYKDHDRVFRLSHPTFALASIAQLNYLQNQMAGMEAWVNIMPNPTSTIKYEGAGFIQKDTYYTTQDYLKVFSQNFIYGNPESALNDVNSLVLTKSMSDKIFGDKNPLGEVLEVSTQISTDNYKVTGVIEDLPNNTSLKFGVLARLPKSFEDQVKNSFSFTTGYSFFKMEGDVEVEDLKEQADQIFAEQRHEQANSGQDFANYRKQIQSELPVVMSLTDIHLHSNAQFEASSPGDIKYLYIFLGIAVFIIVLAAINYINLSTAQASKRAKEVGVRKVLGSFKSDLISRFLAESIMFSLGAVLIGLGLSEASLKLMSASGFSNFSVSIYDFPLILIAVVFVAVITGVLAGIYPALILTSFKPSSVLKGDYRSGDSSKTFRNALVVFQFVVSLSLAVFSVFVYQQLNYGLTKDLGFDKDGVIVLDNSKFQLGRNDENVDAFKNELLQIPAVTNFSGGHYSMIGTLPFTSVMEIGGEETLYRAQHKYTDSEFLPTMGFNLIEGRNFEESIDQDRSVAIVNETFAKMVGDGLFEKHFNAGNNGRDVKVVGVVEDFHYADFTKEIGPTVFFLRDYKSQFNVRIQGNDVQNTLAQIKSVYAQFTDEPLDYYFFDQSFDKLFDTEKRMSQIITIFTGLSLFVALLGMIGLISYKLDQRIKEIGVRKVLGASVFQILRLFSLEMVKLIFIALLITVPLGFYATESWLNSFAFHIEIGVLPFVLVAFVGLGITLLIVSLRTLKTASMNPVDTLRTE